MGSSVSRKAVRMLKPTVTPSVTPRSVNWKISNYTGNMQAERLLDDVLQQRHPLQLHWRWPFREPYAIRGYIV